MPRPHLGQVCPDQSGRRRPSRKILMISLGLARRSSCNERFHLIWSLRCPRDPTKTLPQTYLTDFQEELLAVDGRFWILRSLPRFGTMFAFGRFMAQVYLYTCDLPALTEDRLKERARLLTAAAHHVYHSTSPLVAAEYP